MPPLSVDKNLLLIGASRVLGLTLAQECLERGWRIVAIERDAGRSGCPHWRRSTAAGWRSRSSTSRIPTRSPRCARLAARRFDLLFVNAGVKNADHETIGDISTDEFVRVMVTNALSPMRVIEAMRDLVTADGTIGVMSSGQGSVANNTNGHYEVYRASKAALNMCMRSVAARHAGDARTLLLMAPGWVRTEISGPQAWLSIEESIPNLVDTIDAQAGKGGLQYLDYLGRTMPW